MKNIFYVIAGVFLFVSALGAAEDATPKGLFSAANQMFEKNDVAGAETVYLDLVAKGFEGSALYYNLGNLYYQKGERGKAVLWYERALRLSPRDADIVFNLGLARAHIKDHPVNYVEKYALMFTNAELAWAWVLVSSIFFIVLGMLLMEWIKPESSWAPLVLWLGGIFMVITGVWFGLNTSYNKQSSAVISQPPGEVRNGPGFDYSVGFTLPEGTKILVLDRRPDWVQVGIPSQGLKGWMPSNDVELIAVPWSN